MNEQKIENRKQPIPDMPGSGRRGSIALARRFCYEIAGPSDEDDIGEGGGYGSVAIAEILSAEVERLRAELTMLGAGV